MLSFIEYITENKGYHVGNCKNSFDDNGDCIVPHLPYRDVSHFASGEESAKKITKAEFEKHHNVPEGLKKIHNKKSTIHLHDKENGVHMIYDTHKDVHHFFVGGK